MLLFCKGAPDIILDLCGTKQDEHGPSIMDQSEKERVVDINKENDGQALRVLGLPIKVDGLPNFSDGEWRRILSLWVEGMMVRPDQRL